MTGHPDHDPFERPESPDPALDRALPEDELDTAALQHLLRWVQDGVVSRRQIKELGGKDFDIARLVRHRELTVVHPGVYVNHTGQLSWQQRAWAGVLAHWPAALARESAVPDPPHSGPIHLAVGPRRSVKAVPGTLVRRYPGCPPASPA